MNITLTKCNNIENGTVEIVEQALNIKYAINGTGKSTIGKAISAAVEGDKQKLAELIPFKYLNSRDENQPNVVGIDKIKKITIFNEEYVNQYVFQQDEVIKNSFEIFIRTADYDQHLAEIEQLLQDINIAFQKHPELDTLIQAFSQLIDGFGKSKSGYSASGAIAKGIGKGNKLKNIPHGLESFSPYLQSKSNVVWLKWQMDGKNYLEIADQCPFCTSSISNTKPLILKVSKEFDSKSVEHLNKMISVFKTLLPYFSEETQNRINEIIDNVSGISKTQQEYLLEIKTQTENLLEQLYGLKKIGFHSLKNAEKIADELAKYRLDISLYGHLQSDETKNKVEIINRSLNVVLESAGRLQGAVAQQRILIQRTIEQNNRAINDFMHSAGYNYSVSIQETDAHEYKMILSHNDTAGNSIGSVKSHLSYGERNAFALVLFMFSAIKNDPDLIILDDPISSFDGNKKFAIINMLFMGNTGNCFKGRTVLLLTHEFNTVIDVIYNLPTKFYPLPHACFLSVKNGVLQEKNIKKNDIASFNEIAKKNISTVENTTIKLIYLRRLLEIEKPNSIAWQLLSNIFHKNRQNPKYHGSDSGERDMTCEEISSATTIIKEYYEDFDYQAEYVKATDITALKKAYEETSSNYEKLQFYRLMYSDNSSNDVIRKFVNETFHVENDYLFQLNPRDFDTIPEYIIAECEKDIQTLSLQQTGSESC